MSTLWFILAVIFVVMYIFNTGVSAPPNTKNAVNIIGIILSVVLAILATKPLF